MTVVEADVGGLVRGEFKSKRMPIDKLMVDAVNYRAVDLDSQEFKDFAYAIKTQGVHVPPHCRKPKDEEGNLIPGFLSIIDGANRLKAAELAGFTHLTVMVADWPMTDTECWALQMSLNKHRIKPKKSDEVNCIRLLMADDPNIDREALARTFGITVQELSSIGGLKNLIPEAEKMVEAGDIKMSAAYELARCTEKKYPGLQAQLLEYARDLPVDQFAEKAQESKKAFLKGHTTVSKDLMPTYRPLKETIAKWEEVNDKLEALGEDSTQTVPAYEALLELRDSFDYILRMDPESRLQREKKKKTKTTAAEKTTKANKERDDALAELAKYKELAAQKGIDIPTL